MHDRPAPTAAPTAVPNAAPAHPRRFGPAIGAVLGVAAILAVAFVVAKGRDVGLERPQVGDVLLATEVSLASLPAPAAGDGAAGTSMRVRVRKPSRLSFDVKASAPVRVVFGVPRPPEEGPEDLPDATGAVAWTVDPGQAPHEEMVLAAGMYVVRVERAPTSPGSRGGPVPAGPVGVRVTALPPR